LGDMANSAIEDPSITASDDQDEDEERTQPGCRICGGEEDVHLLIAPCNCSGSLQMVHTTCLQRWIVTRPQASDNAHQTLGEPDAALVAALPGGGGRVFTSADSRLTCEICHSDYNINVAHQYSFRWSRCCKWNSLGHCFELGICLFIFALCLAVGQLAKNVDSQEPAFGSKQADKIAWPVIETLLGLLALFTMYRVFRRWQRANSEITILPNSVAPTESAKTENDPSNERIVVKTEMLDTSSPLIEDGRIDIMSPTVIDDRELASPFSPSQALSPRDDGDRSHSSLSSFTNF